MSNNNVATTTVAFLGAGRMGAPMATRLIEAGFAVQVWNRSAERVKSLVDLGATSLSSPAKAASGVDFLVTMLPDGPLVEAAMIGPEGGLETLRPGAVWLQMSSIGVEWTAQLKALADAKGVVFVDAPVSGSVAPATSGTLLILASGPSEVREHVAP